MKKLRIAQFLALLVLPFFVGTSTSGQKRLQEVDLRINGIASGSSYSSIVRKLGKPLSRRTEKSAALNSCSGKDETFVTLKYEGLGIRLLGDGRGRKLSVFSMDVSSEKWLASGARLGDSTYQVRKRFGKPVSQAILSGKLIFYYVTPGNLGGVNFEFKKKKLVRIKMNETLC